MVFCTSRSLKNEIHRNEGQVKLYSNQVFVADNIKEIIPEFLLLLKGVDRLPRPAAERLPFVPAERRLRSASFPTTSPARSPIA